MANIIPDKAWVIKKNQKFKKYFAIMAYKLILTKVKELSKEEHALSPYIRTFEYYGLSTMNAYYYPFKYFVAQPSIWQFHEQRKWFTEASNWHLDANWGTNRYLVLYPMHNEALSLFMIRLRKGIVKLMKGCFLEKFLMNGAVREDQLMENPEKELPVPTPEWNIPKKVWVIWDAGIKNSRATNQMAVENMRRKAKLSGFELTVVDSANAEQYVDK